MTATAPDDDAPRDERRRLGPWFWDRETFEGRQCGRCSLRMLAWHDGTGHFWVMCRACDVDPPRSAGSGT